MELLIGDKVWSSWSLRPWLVLKHAGADFTETLIRLRQASSDLTAEAAGAAGSPSKLVPVLKDGDLVIWDSLAICEYLAEQIPAARLWPSDPVKRALGRCAVAEMHSGFHSLRGECSMDLSQRVSVDVSEATAKDIRRVVALWTDLLGRFGGPFLLGEWSIADAFYTPVATRFRTYGLRLSDFGDTGAAGRYATRLLETPEFLEWAADALADPRTSGS
jgi:glutathione S-transferase